MIAAASSTLAASLHVTYNPVDWYVARAGGIVAYLILSAAVVAGLTMASRKTLKLWPRFVLEDVHRFLGILGGVFIAIHVGAIALDAYLPFSAVQLAIPFLSSYRPLWTGLGIVSAELLIALAVTNHYRRSLSPRLWKRLHYLNFAVWAGATLHGLGAGTDRNAVWMLGIYAVATGLVGGLTAWRILRPRFVGLGAQYVLPAAAALCSVGVAFSLALFVGFAGSRPHPKPQFFSEPVSGKIVVQQGASEGIVSMVGSSKGVRPLIVRADLLVSSAQSSPKDTAFQMEYLPAGTRCTGTLTHVESQGFSAVCTLPGGLTRHVEASWQIGAQAPGDDGSSSSSANSLLGTVTVGA